jgi:hypothetical protein
LPASTKKTQKGCGKTGRVFRAQSKDFLEGAGEEELTDATLSHVPINKNCEKLPSKHEIVTYTPTLEEFRELNAPNDDPEALFAAIGAKLGVKPKEKAVLKEAEVPGSDNDMPSDEDEPEVNHDINFLVYKNNILADQDQILRYCFHPKTRPMFYSAFKAESAAKVPKCDHCGGPRAFELQINNTLLSFVPELGHLHWGVLCVFSCLNSCFSKQKDALISEYLWIQEENLEAPVTAPVADKDLAQIEEEDEPEPAPEEKSKGKKKKGKKGKEPEGKMDFNEYDWA